jgi:iduronate 2-sulfatase
MNRNLLRSICILVFIGQSWSTIYAASSEQPNIVLIISDDHDNEHLGFMGNKTVRTPNIDRLAAQGTVFNTCYLTASRCRPSLASLLSGRLPHQNGIYANILKDKDKGKQDADDEKMLSPKDSLPNLLKEAGYATYGSGKYWEGDGREMGFTHGLGKKRSFGQFGRKGQDELFDFIDEQSEKAPMFIWWAPLMPHTPHNPPVQFLEMFDPKEIPVPDYIKPGDREEFIKKEHLSLAMEAWTDDEIGKLRTKLKEKGEDKNTMYVFLIDNGWSNGLPAKGSVFEKGVRTPAFFSLPGRIPANKKRDDLISSLDIYPTILSYAGVKTPSSAMGIDLQRNIEVGTPVGRIESYGAIYPTMATNNGQYPERDVYALYVRTGNWKYVFYTRDVQGDVASRPFKLHHILAEAPLRHRGDQNLYNLKDDPLEMNDLSKNPKHKAFLNKLKGDVFRWWNATGGKAIPVKMTSFESPIKKQLPNLQTRQLPNSSKASSVNLEKPNLLFIAIDDLRPQLGCYGESWMKTPNIDRLAASGLLFNRHYVQVTTCGASRHALLTGLRPSVIEDYGNGPFKVHRDELAARPTESFPHLFKQNGYRTVVVGKVSHSNSNSSDDLSRSWSEVLQLKRRWGTRHNFVNAYAQIERPESAPQPRNKGYAFESVQVDDKGYPDGWIAEHAVNALNDLKSEPFCLAVGFVKPHLPFNAPTKYWDLYDPNKIPAIPFPSIPKNIDPNISLHPSFELMGQYDVPQGGLNDVDYIRKLRHGYCAAVSYADAQVGKVLDELDRLDLSKNTIVVLWGDHGWHLGDLGTWGKHTAYERALRSPLIVRLPEMKLGGQVTDALVETVDIYPTLAELCNLPSPQGLGGDSFAALLHDLDAPAPTEAFGYHRPWKNPNKPDPWGKTLRTDRYRFTVWTTERTGGDVVQVELYDHDVDSEESENIAGNYPALVQDMLARMGDDGMPWNPNMTGRELVK